MKDIYDKAPTDLKYFDKTDLMEIESMAEGLTETEILDYYALDLSELVDSDESGDSGEGTPTPDLIWLRKAFNRGRSKAKIKATQRLFSSMSDRKSGGPMAIQYLRQVSEAWPVEGANGGEGGFSFKVIMD